MRNCQTNLPVITSYARRSPGGDSYSSPVADPQNDQILEDATRCAGLNQPDHPWNASKPVAQVDGTVVAKALNRLSRGGIQNVQLVIHREEQTPIGSVFALPVRHSAMRDQARIWDSYPSSSSQNQVRDCQDVLPAAMSFSHLSELASPKRDGCIAAFEKR